MNTHLYFIGATNDNGSLDQIVEATSSDEALDLWVKEWFEEEDQDDYTRFLLPQEDGTVVQVFQIPERLHKPRVLSWHQPGGVGLVHRVTAPSISNPKDEN